MSFHTAGHNAAQLFDICEFVLSMLNEFYQYYGSMIQGLNNLANEQSVGYEKVIICACQKLKVCELIQIGALISW